MSAVLERLALDQPSEQQSAPPWPELVVEIDLVVVGKQRRAFSSTSVAAINKNSVATIEILHPFEFSEIGIDDLRQSDLIEIDLFAQDRVQQQIEGPVEHRRAPRAAARP